MSNRGEKEDESRSRKNVRVEQQFFFSGLIFPEQIIMLAKQKDVQVNIFRTHFSRDAKGSPVHL